MLNMHAAVRLTVDLPKDALRRGAIGAVVAIFSEPTLAYEVEFVDALGRTLAQVTLREEEIEEVKV